MKTKGHKCAWIKRAALSVAAFMAVIVVFTVYANIKVANAAHGRIYAAVDSVPHTLLL